jgi:hypothetical protein
MCRILAVSLVAALGLNLAFAQDRPLGWLSSQYEVGSGGPGTISSGKFKKKDADTGEVTDVDDPGGKSYGSYQFASKRGIDGSSVAAFVKRYYAEDFREPKAGAPGQFTDLQPGTEPFDKKWNDVVARDGVKFTNNEHEFIHDTHYLPVVNALKELGLDINSRSDALKNAIWSTAVQHGPPQDAKGHAVKLLKAALGSWGKKDLQATDPKTKQPVVGDEALLKAIYDERGRKTKSGKMVYFAKGLDLSKRFNAERKNALKALDQERRDRGIAPTSPAGTGKPTKLEAIAKSLGINANMHRRRPRDLVVARGQVTFDTEGQEGGRYHSRRPHVPSGNSGVTIGRGYDMKGRKKEQIYRDLLAAGLSKAQAELYSRAAGLSGNKARAFLAEHGYGRLLDAARKKGLKGAEVNSYIRANSLEPITLAQQKKLFERTYAQVEDEVKNQFPAYVKYPRGAQEAITDMAYNLGISGLLAKFPKFVEAVQAQDWGSAAAQSRRKGVGVSRNAQVRQLLEQAAAARQADKGSPPGA